MGNRSRVICNTKNWVWRMLRPSTRLGISADYNVNNMFSMKSGLYYTFRGYSVNNGGTYSNGDATWIENVSQTRHFLQVPIFS